MMRARCWLCYWADREALLVEERGRKSRSRFVAVDEMAGEGGSKLRDQSQCQRQCWSLSLCVQRLKGIHHVRVPPKIQGNGALNERATRDEVASAARTRGVGGRESGGLFGIGRFGGDCRGREGRERREEKWKVEEKRERESVCVCVCCV